MRRMPKWSSILTSVVLVSLMLLGGSAYGQQGTCMLPTTLKASDTVELRVNFGSFSGAPNVTQEEVRVSALHAVSEWSNSGAGAAAFFGGNTGCTDFTGPGCCDSHLLTYDDTCVGSERATATSGCGAALLTHITICGSTSNGQTPRIWNTRGFQSGEFDLVSTVTHEFGHALGLHHPAAGGCEDDCAGDPVCEAACPPDEAAVMGTAPSVSDTRRRELYYYDQKCIEDGNTGYRELMGRRRVQYPSGGLGSEGLMNLHYDNLSNHDAETYEFGGVERHGIVWREANSIHFRRRTVGSPVQTFGGVYLGAELGLNAHDESGGGPLRIVWSEHVPGTEWEWGAPHQAQVRWSTDEFTNSASAPLFECVVPTGWYGCAPLLSWAPVYTGHRLQTDFDPASVRTVSVWSHQARSNNGPGDRAIRVSIGDVSPALLATSYEMPGARTIASPGIACQSGEAEGTDGRTYDCIVAYSDIDTDDFRVRIGRFFATSAGTHMRPEFDGGLTTVDALDAETTAGIVTWWADDPGRWFIAFLATDDDQPLRVYSSTDSLFWSFVGDYSWGAAGSFLSPRLDRWNGTRAQVFSAR